MDIFKVDSESFGQQAKSKPQFLDSSVSESDTRGWFSKAQIQKAQWQTTRGKQHLIT